MEEHGITAALALLLMAADEDWLKQLGISPSSSR
jgi:hypothetical protein